MVLSLILAVAEEGGGGESTNPILPETNELIWGAISFVVLMVLVYKFGFPAIKKGLDARAERIKGDLAAAETAKDEANTVLDEYRRQLADAKGEAGRIIEEARQAADRMATDLRKRAEKEVAEIKQRAQEDISAQAARTMADLQARVSLLAIELAEKVVERNLDRDTNTALINQFIDQVGNGGSRS